jgi:hypothetical protein
VSPRGSAAGRACWRTLDAQRARLWTRRRRRRRSIPPRQGPSRCSPTPKRAAGVRRHAGRRDLDRYGDNAFGWSLLMARRLVEAGVRLVQVNLGNNETWDTHGNAFPHLKDKLLPPTDRASRPAGRPAESGLLDSTLS